MYYFFCCFVFGFLVGVLTRASVLPRNVTPEITTDFHLAPAHQRLAPGTWAVTQGISYSRIPQQLWSCRQLWALLGGLPAPKCPQLPTQGCPVQAHCRLADLPTSPPTLHLPCQKPHKETPSSADWAASLPVPGKSSPARPAASSSFHTSLTFSLKVNWPKQGRGSHPTAAGCKQSMLLPLVKGKQQQLTLLLQEQEHDTLQMSNDLH